MGPNQKHTVHTCKTWQPFAQNEKYCEYCGRHGRGDQKPFITDGSTCATCKRSHHAKFTLSVFCLEPPPLSCAVGFFKQLRSLSRGSFDICINASAIARLEPSCVWRSGSPLLGWNVCSPGFCCLLRKGSCNPSPAERGRGPAQRAAIAKSTLKTR